MNEIRVRLKWLMSFRVVVVTLLLGLSITFQIARNELVIAYYALIVLTYVITIAYAFALRYLDTPQRLQQFAGWLVRIAMRQAREEMQLRDSRDSESLGTIESNPSTSP